MDRNIIVYVKKTRKKASLSARRAWIEINMSCNVVKRSAVALRKESVDRNRIRQDAGEPEVVALRKESVDRNICPASRLRKLFLVALRKESVDRNVNLCNITTTRTRRSPQGERG